MLNRTPFLIILSVLFLASCGERPIVQTSETITATDSDSLSNLPTGADIEAMLHEHVAILASDEFEGRAPATAGEEKTISYLMEQFEALGIAPGNNGSYFQSVDVTEITTSNNPVLQIQGNSYEASFNYGEQMMAGTQHQIPAISVQDSEMVFVGYGIVAPET